MVDAFTHICSFFAAMELRFFMFWGECCCVIVTLYITTASTAQANGNIHDAIEEAR